MIPYVCNVDIPDICFVRPAEGLFSYAGLKLCPFFSFFLYPYRDSISFV